jgi:hypothetical protein
MELIGVLHLLPKKKKQINRKRSRSREKKEN